MTGPERDISIAHLTEYAQHREEPLSRVPTPMRHRRGRPVATGFNWLPAEQVPGAILSPQAQRDLDERLRALREWEGRSRVSAASYWIGR